jgi:hypothetical protein
MDRIKGFWESLKQKILFVLSILIKKSLQKFLTAFVPNCAITDIISQILPDTEKKQ